MHCPRCGARTEEGDRYCASCGATLSKVEAPRRSPRERIAGLIGTTRRARLLTAATAVVIAAAIVAFFSLPQDEESVPQDAYTLDADAICVQQKQRIADAIQGSSGDPGRYAGAIVRNVAEWRKLFNDLAVPDDRVVLASNLDTALREVEVEAGAIARISREGGADLISHAEQADQAAQRVEQAVNDLGLKQCSDIAVGLGPAQPAERSP